MFTKLSITGIKGGGPELCGPIPGGGGPYGPGGGIPIGPPGPLGPGPPGPIMCGGGG